MIQVSRLGSYFTVLVDGVADRQFHTRNAAIQHALKLRGDIDTPNLGD